MGTKNGNSNIINLPFSTQNNKPSQKSLQLCIADRAAFVSAFLSF
jgi:hypothetical protein